MGTALPFAVVEGPAEGPVGGGVAGFLPWFAPGLSLGFLGGIPRSWEEGELEKKEGEGRREMRGASGCLRGRSWRG